MKNGFFFLCLLVLSGCVPIAPEVPQVSNPFPQSNTNDGVLVQNFQDLATDERLLTYQLVSVQKGNLRLGQKYQVPFVSPARKKLVLVAACGQGCTSMGLTLQNEGGTFVGNTSSSREKTYIALNVGTSSQPLISNVWLENCQTRTCAAYWALYAR